METQNDKKSGENYRRKIREGSDEIKMVLMI